MTFETVRGDDVHETAAALPDSWYDPMGPLYGLRRRLWTLTTYTIGAAAVAGFFVVAGNGEVSTFGTGLLRLMLALAAIEVLAIVGSIAYDHLHERHTS